jgi:spore coat polysaccharide biosynthesis predicted glycosyltransferase SpsG
MNALIICYSSKKIGIGHLSRSKFLLNILKKNFGWNVKILLINDIKENLNYVDSNIIHLDPNEDIQLFIESQKLFSKIIFFDFHPKIIPNNFTEFLIKSKNKDVKLVAIDCLVNYQKLLDLIIIPSFFLEDKKNLQNGCPILHGWEYLILNPQIKKKKFIDGNRILILSGGSDVKSLGNTLPKNLNKKLPEGFIVDWVTGPYSSKPNFDNCKRIKIIEHVAPKNIFNLIENANFAITLYGISFFELLYAGIPTIVFSAIKNKDDMQLEIIKKKNIALVANDQLDAVNLLCLLLENNKLAKNLNLNSQKYMNLVDNLKIVEAIKKIL